jgi:N-methylhydantoinase A
MAQAHTSKGPAETNGSAGSRLAIDVGGTFIDFVLFDEATGEVRVDKELSRHTDLAAALFRGFDRLAADGRAVGRLIHGSTLVINTILQESGSPVGLITTAGFRDVLELGRGNRTDIYDFLWGPTPPIVPRRLRREVAGRMGADGAELEPLDLEGLVEQGQFLVDAGVDAIAVCLLHSYANAEHERVAVETLAARFPDVFVTASYEMSTEWREYERTSTAVLNAHVLKVVGRYLGDLETGLGTRTFAGDLSLMQSNGGVMPVAAARRAPIRMLESGPAGGVIGALALCKVLDEPNVICADVGGTTFDVALVHQHRISERQNTSVNGRPVMAPTVDIESVGAGGGSIASVDEHGVFRVGPRSAGAYPGPACFGAGGENPTVTDCNVLLGRLDPSRFLGERMQLDVGAAERVVGELAEALGMSPIEAAGGTIRLAETNMVHAIRQTTVEKGHDPRDFALLGYGGGSGLFAAALIEELDIPRAIVPRNAALFSAWGLLFADYREDAARVRVIPVVEENLEQLAATIEAVADEALEKLLAHGIPEAEARRVANVDVRFVGQEHTLTTPVETGQEPAEMAKAITARFVERHRAEYGQADETLGIEVVTVRASAVGAIPHPDLTTSTVPDGAHTPRGTREVWFSGQGGLVETTIWSRDDLARGKDVPGPAVIEEWNTTTLVEPGQLARVDEFGNVVIYSRRTAKGA